LFGLIVVMKWFSSDPSPALQGVPVAIWFLCCHRRRLDHNFGHPHFFSLLMMMTDVFCVCSAREIDYNGFALGGGGDLGLRNFAWQIREDNEDNCEMTNQVRIIRYSTEARHY
jgi:hypothetical protein